MVQKKYVFITIFIITIGIVLTSIINTKCTNIQAILYNLDGDCMLIYLSTNCNYTKLILYNQIPECSSNKTININILTDSCITQCFTYKKNQYLIIITLIILLSIYLYYYIYKAKIYYYYSINKETYTCPICLDDIIPSEIYNDAVKISYCNCSDEKPPLHEKCISAWLKKKSICPICREQV